MQIRCLFVFCSSWRAVVWLAGRVVTYCHIFSRFRILTTNKQCRLEARYDGTHEGFLWTGSSDFIIFNTMYAVEFRVGSQTSRQWISTNFYKIWRWVLPNVSLLVILSQPVLCYIYCPVKRFSRPDFSSRGVKHETMFISESIFTSRILALYSQASVKHTKKNHPGRAVMCLLFTSKTELTQATLGYGRFFQLN